ncbi:hypothetical protein BC829DRAFT_424072 [Chytridium lagenaria]|nr:hypothetical protein BC829DRAFT_424072 [Chytridium lagenaria]
MRVQQGLGIGGCWWREPHCQGVGKKEELAGRNLAAAAYLLVGARGLSAVDAEVTVVTQTRRKRSAGASIRGSQWVVRLCVWGIPPTSDVTPEKAIRVVSSLPFGLVTDGTPVAMMVEEVLRAKVNDTVDGSSPLESGAEAIKATGVSLSGTEGKDDKTLGEVEKDKRRTEMVDLAKKVVTEGRGMRRVLKRGGSWGWKDKRVNKQQYRHQKPRTFPNYPQTPITRSSRAKQFPLSGLEGIGDEMDVGVGLAEAIGSRPDRSNDFFDTLLSTFLDEVDTDKLLTAQSAVSTNIADDVSKADTLVTEEARCKVVAASPSLLSVYKKIGASVRIEEGASINMRGAPGHTRKLVGLVPRNPVKIFGLTFFIQAFIIDYTVDPKPPFGLLLGQPFIDLAGCQNGVDRSRQSMERFPTQQDRNVILNVETVDSRARTISTARPVLDKLVPTVPNLGLFTWEMIIKVLRSKTTHDKHGIFEIKVPNMTNVAFKKEKGWGISDFKYVPLSDISRYYQSLIGEWFPSIFRDVLQPPVIHSKSSNKK